MPLFKVHLQKHKDALTHFLKIQKEPFCYILVSLSCVWNQIFLTASSCQTDEGKLCLQSLKWFVVDILWTET